MLRGLLTKIRPKWYEGVFLGALLLLGLALYLQTQRVESLAGDLHVSEEAVQQAVALHANAQERQKIDQTVVATVTQDLVENRHQQRLDREELIRDYLIFKNAAEDTSVPVTPTPDPTPTEVAEAAPAVNETPPRVPEAQSPTPEPDRAVTTDHFDRLARGMRDTYCRAGGTSADCTANQSD